MGLTTKSRFPTFQGPTQAVVPTPTFSGLATENAADSINPYTSQGPGEGGAGQTYNEIKGIGPVLGLRPCFNTARQTSHYTYSNDVGGSCFTVSTSISGSNTMTVADSNHTRTRGNGLISGKWYIEYIVDTISPTTQSGAIGLGESTFNWGTNRSAFRIAGAGQFGRENVTNGWYSFFMSTSNGAPWSFGTIGDGGTLMFGADLDTGEIRIGRNGTWDTIKTMSGTLLAKYQSTGAVLGFEFWDGNGMTIRNPADYLYSAPEGYTPGWGT